MKKTSVSKLLLSASLFALAGAFSIPTVHADETVKKERKVSKKTLEKYDLNHNGVLDPDEEAALKADREKARVERKKKKEDAGAKEDGSSVKEDGAADSPN